MNIHFSYKNTSNSPEVERITRRRIEKINKLLSTFQPDLVHLHGALERQNPREGFVTSLNLRLPIGQIHASEAGKTAAVSLRSAFDELERQIKEEKDLLRGDRKRWQRSGATAQGRSFGGPLPRS